MLKGHTPRTVTFEPTPQTVIPVEETEEDSDGESEETEERPFVPGERTLREKAGWRRFGDGTKEWNRCREDWKSYEEVCERHLHDIELFI